MSVWFRCAPALVNPRRDAVEGKKKALQVPKRQRVVEELATTICKFTSVYLLQPVEAHGVAVEGITAMFGSCSSIFEV